MTNGYMDVQYWAGYWPEYWPVYGGTPPAPVIESTMDNHHVRLWNFGNPIGQRFGGYSKR